MKRNCCGVVLILLLTGILAGCAIRRGVVHEVEQGQTLWRIAQVYDVRLDTLMQVNDITNARRVEAGTRIVIPGAATPRDVPSSPQRRVARSTSSPVASDAGNTGTYDPPDSTARTSSSTASTAPSSTESTTDSSAAGLNETATGGSAEEKTRDSSQSEGASSGDQVYFDPVWPCRGRLASRYDKNGGPTKRGIRIHTSTGSTVRAADAGNIKLAGEWEKMPDLGKIVIIFHSNNFTTVYAHLKSVKVSEGSKVKRGQPIGTVGRSGDVSQPMCYFEVRYKLEPRDPLIFLGEPS